MPSVEAGDLELERYFYQGSVGTPSILTGYFKANRIQAKKGEEARTEYLAKFNAWVYRLRSASG